MTSRIPPRALDPAGGAPGQAPVINAAGDRVDWADVAGGGGASTLDALTDVDTTTTPPADTQALVFDTGSGLWVPGYAGNTEEILEAPVAPGVARTSTSSGTFTALTWPITFATDVYLDALRWDARNSGDYTLSVNGADVSTVTAPTSPTTPVTFTPAAPIRLTGGIAHTFKIRRATAATQYFSTSNTRTGTGTQYIQAWGLWAEATNAYVAATLDLTPIRIVHAELPINDATVTLDSTWSSSKISGDLGGKAPTAHSHDYAATVHTHDDRYYTEAEVDTALSGKAATAHGHAIADVTSLQASLDGKAPTSHTHTKASITDFAHTHLIADLPTDATVPAALGTAAAGTAATVARRDHVHTMPTAADVGAAATSHTHTRMQITDAGNAIALNAPSSGDAAAGEVVLGSDSRLGTRSRARAYSSGTAPSIPNNTSTIIPLPSEEFDTNNLHDNVTNNTRITLDKAGVWMVFGRIGYSGNATGRRFASAHKNGVEVIAASLYPSTSNPAYVSFSGFTVAAVGDYLELSAHQDNTSLADLTIQNASSNATFLAAVHLGA